MGKYVSTVVLTANRMLCCPVVSYVGNSGHLCRVTPTVLRFKSLIIVGHGEIRRPLFLILPEEGGEGVKTVVLTEGELGKKHCS